MKTNLTNMDRYNLERQEQIANRKSLVLDAAQRLFLQKGLSNTTMNDIMKEAKVSKATLYRYFDSIDPIAFEIEYRMLNEIFENVFIVENNELTAEEVVLSTLLVLIDEFHEHEHAHRYISMFDNMYSKEYPSEKLSDEYHEFFENLNRSTKDMFSKDMSEYGKLVTSMNVVLSFLQRLATRGKQLEKHQSISVDTQLEEFRKMIEREFSYE